MCLPTHHSTQHSQHTFLQVSNPTPSFPSSTPYNIHRGNLQTTRPRDPHPQKCTEYEIGSKEYGVWRMEYAEWRMKYGEWRMENGECSMEWSCPSMCCSVLQCGAVCCSAFEVLQSLLQCVAVCCSVVQCYSVLSMQQNMQ